MRVLVALVASIAVCGVAAAQKTPLPRARSAAPAITQDAPAAERAEPAVEPSACRLRMTDDLAIAPSLPDIHGPGECGADDLVQLEAIVLPNRSRVAVTPPAILRCTLAEAVVQWVREDLTPLVDSFGARLKNIENYASYDCRGRNRMLGAPLSEHGKANALDIRSLKLANGRVVQLTDVQVSRNFRDNLRRATCARFMTVLGPGSDGFHEEHIHVDLAERSSGNRLCHWEVREPDAAIGGSPVPLPRPRPSGA
jgi:hypothetical protein